MGVRPRPGIAVNTDSATGVVSRVVDGKNGECVAERDSDDSTELASLSYLRTHGSERR